MTATAGNERAFMLGGDGADLMIGGAGIDTYIIEGSDTIQDMGNNRIYYQGQLMAGGKILTDKKSLNFEPCPDRVVRQIYDGDWRGRQMVHEQWRMAA